MSYCRWTTGDIYCYQSDRGWEVLIANPPEGEKSYRLCRSPGEAASFMRELKEKGVCVQMDAVEELEAEQREMDEENGLSDAEVDAEQSRAEEALDRFERLERRVAELEKRVICLEAQNGK